MSKHKKAGTKRGQVGKSGSPPSSTKNEKPRSQKAGRKSLPKVRKETVGGERRGGGLH